MKIRNPKLISGVARTIAWVMRGWMQTISIQYRPLVNYLENDRPALLGGARYIFASWHEHILAQTYMSARSDTAALIGQHADGELIAQVGGHFGASVIRGSSTRGGAMALIKMIRTGTRHIAISPDGPRGPRRTCQLGIVYLASVTGLSVVPLSVGYRGAWRFGSWDRLAVPMPFGRIRIVSGHPIPVPAKGGEAGLEHYRLEVERMLNLTCDIADHWAETGEFDPLGYTPPAGWTPTGRRQFASARQKPYSPST